MPRPRFTLRALLVLILAVACFFGGLQFERERQGRADEAAARQKGFVDAYLQIELNNFRSQITGKPLPAHPARF